jgi:hypothetical protein
MIAATECRLEGRSKVNPMWCTTVASLFSLTLTLATSVPAMAQIPPDIAKTLIIVSVQRDDSFGCQNLETYLAVVSSFAKVEDGATRNSILAPLLRIGECSRFRRGEQLYDLTIAPGVSLCPAP